VTTELVERLRAWTYRRQMLGCAASDAVAALRAVVGVYSTHPTAPLSLLARCDLQPEELQRLEQERLVVRIPGMRESSFLVARADAPQVLAATQQPEQRLERRLRDGGLSMDTYRTLSQRVLDCTHEPRFPREISACAGDPAAVLVARVLARAALVLRVNSNLRVDQLRWVATQAWLGETLTGSDCGAALRWLGAEYLRGFGPARVEDFSWWAGLSRREAAQVLQDLEIEDVGEGFLLGLADVGAFGSVATIAGDAIDVLPKWDAYTMAYAPTGRQRLLADEHARLAYTSRDGSPGATAGDGLPLVLRGGRAVGTWSHRFQARSMPVEIAPFPGERVDLDALEAPFQRIARLMGASAQLRLARQAA